MRRHLVKGRCSMNVFLKVLPLSLTPFVHEQTSVELVSDTQFQTCT